MARRNMKALLSSRWLYLILRIVLGGLFVYAGGLKLADPQAFAIAVDGYGLVTWRMANLIARILPVVEIMAGIGLILDIRGALGVIVVQLLGFMGVLAYGIHMGLDIDCGCFGPSDSGEPVSLWETMFRDVLMLAACLIMYVQRRVAGFEPRPLLTIFQRK